MGDTWLLSVTALANVWASGKVPLAIVTLKLDTSALGVGPALAVVVALVSVVLSGIGFGLAVHSRLYPSFWFLQSGVGRGSGFGDPGWFGVVWVSEVVLSGWLSSRWRLRESCWWLWPRWRFSPSDATDGHPHLSAFTLSPLDPEPESGRGLLC